MANLRLILDVEVQAGHQTASKYSAPGLWEWLKRLPRPHWPVFIRGDRDWGTEANMQRAEQEGLPYLFKLRMTAGVKKSVERLMREAPWCAAGQGWEGAETTLRLVGWSRSRRAIVLRRRVKNDLVVVDQGDPHPQFASHHFKIASTSDSAMPVTSLHRPMSVNRLKAKPPPSTFLSNRIASIMRGPARFGNATGKPSEDRYLEIRSAVPLGVIPSASPSFASATMPMAMASPCNTLA